MARVAADDAMTIDERRKYLKRMRPRYERAGREGRSALLNEMEAVTGLHRKSLLRLLHAPSLERQQRQRQRGRTYGAAVAQVVLRVWASLDYICAERLTPTLVETARHLAGFGVLTLSAEVEAQLGQISEASVTRLLARHRTERLRLPRGGPERANSATRDVPMTHVPHPHPLGHAGAGPLRGRSGPPCGGDDGGRVCPYPATGGCGHGLE